MPPPRYGGITEEEELEHTFHEVDIFKDENVSYEAGVLKMHDTDGRVVASTQGTMVWRAGQWVMSTSAAASGSKHLFPKKPGAVLINMVCFRCLRVHPALWCRAGRESSRYLSALLDSE